MSAAEGGNDEAISAATAGHGSFLAGVGASFVLKLTTSVDDLVWFSSFLAMSTSTPERARYCVVYVLVCVLVATSALFLAKAAEAGFDAAAGAITGGGEGDGANGGSWHAHTALSLLASAVVFAYALVELRGWLKEGNELPSAREVWAVARRRFRRRCHSSPDASNSTTQQKSDAHLSVEFTGIHDDNDPMECLSEDRTTSIEKGVSGATKIAETTLESSIIKEEGGADGGDDEVRATVRAASRSTYALFTVALCGTVDDMILFAAVVAGRGIPWTSVLPGSILAAVAVLGACWRVSLYKPFANFVRRVPLWALLGAVSLYLLVMAFV